MRRKWLVAYSFQNGQGRAFLTSKDVPLSSDLVMQFEEYLREGNPELGRLFVGNVIPLELIEPVEEASCSDP